MAERSEETNGERANRGDTAEVNRFTWMPRWVVSCPECGHAFTFEAISQTGEGNRDPFASPPKPKIPEGGAALVCPRCSKTSVYGALDLRYRR